MEKTCEHATKDYLGRSYIWALYKMLPGFGYFVMEIIDSRDGEVLEDIEFSKNSEAEEGTRKLYELLGRYPDNYSNLESEFVYGFGFDLRIRVFV